ncbi:MAG: hypothetical protein WCL39_13010, partial [Armatimonadota bacterium]
KETWNPHIVFDPNFQQGEIRGSFDVRVDPGAIVRHEWRDAASPYHIGPNLIIAADGNLSANGKSIMAMKHGMWYHIAIDCIIGKNAPGRYTLTIKPPDGNAIVQSIPCPDNLLELRWFGFISNANADTTFYLDNINIDQNPGKSKTD